MVDTVLPRLKSDSLWNLKTSFILFYNIISLDGIEASLFFVFTVKTIQVKTGLRETLVMMMQIMKKDCDRFGQIIAEGMCQNRNILTFTKRFLKQLVLLQLRTRSIVEIENIVTSVLMRIAAFISCDLFLDSDSYQKDCMLSHV